MEAAGLQLNHNGQFIVASHIFSLLACILGGFLVHFGRGFWCILAEGVFGTFCAKTGFFWYKVGFFWHSPPILPLRKLHHLPQSFTTWHDFVTLQPEEFVLMVLLHVLWSVCHWMTLYYSIVLFSQVGR